MEELNFEEMRNQIAALKNKLDNQDIVNDKLIHEVVNTKVDSIKRKQMVSVICAIIVIIVSPYSFHYNMGASWWFIIGTDLLMILCMYREISLKRIINDRELMNSSMLEVAQRMSKFKSNYKRWTIFSLSCLLPMWVLWLFAEMFLAQSGHMDHVYAYAIGLAAGLAAGLCIGLYLYRRIINTADDIIRQIEEK